MAMRSRVCSLLASLASQSLVDGLGRGMAATGGGDAPAAAEDMHFSGRNADNTSSAERDALMEEW